MVQVGLTGGIGSGKSAVADLLAGHGAVIIDADLLAREAVLPGTEALDQIVHRFGQEVLTESGELNRAALGEIVFNDKQALTDLEAITHPAIRALSAQRTAQAGDEDVIVHVIPLLVESDQQGRFDVVVVVDVPEETQLARVQSRDGWDPEHIRARMDAQVSREQRLAAADHVIDNSGDRDELAAQVERLWAALLPKRNMDRT